jgi:hypothetical protein
MWRRDKGTPQNVEQRSDRQEPAIIGPHGTTANPPPAYELNSTFPLGRPSDSGEVGSPVLNAGPAMSNAVTNGAGTPANISTTPAAQSQTQAYHPLNTAEWNISGARSTSWDVIPDAPGSEGEALRRRMTGR